jgi:hypothetical protein
MVAIATVVYYNSGKGNWSISYNGKTKSTFKKTSTDTWFKTENISLGTISGSGEIMLFSPDQEDCIFSLLEVLEG